MAAELAPGHRSTTLRIRLQLRCEDRYLSAHWLSTQRRPWAARRSDVQLFQSSTAHQGGTEGCNHIWGVCLAVWQPCKTAAQQRRAALFHCDETDPARDAQGGQSPITVLGKRLWAAGSSNRATYSGHATPKYVNRCLISTGC